MFDLRAGKVRWETNVRNGVCGTEFDRKEIQMNKFCVTTLESQVRVRSPHPAFSLIFLTPSERAPQPRCGFQTEFGRTVKSPSAMGLAAWGFASTHFY
jgi:hypothetical protein